MALLCDFRKIMMYRGLVIQQLHFTFFENELSLFGISLDDYFIVNIRHAKTFDIENHILLRTVQKTMEDLISIDHKYRALYFMHM